jgi:hypothetical protein
VNDRGMRLRQATVLEFRGPATLAGHTTAVSLHAHTNRSNEGMANVSRYLERIPLVAPLVRRQLRVYLRRNGESVDFKKGWWHPPVDPQTVLASETSQIRQALGLRPVVSITDHDSIDAGLELQRQHSHALVPLSFEWTVPFHQGFFHLGVHNLRSESATRRFQALSAYTHAPDAARLAGLLEALNSDRETLVVLNHPLWDLAGIGSADHVALLRRFLVDHGDMIHGLELNGYRSSRENSGVRTLAEAYALPLISGGDRHGCAPNALLNVTTATSFGEFAREIRERRQSVILVMPQYRTSLVARKLTSAADTMREYPFYPPGQQRWTDRVSYERHGTVRSLSVAWPRGGPLWVRAAVRAFQLGASAPLLPLLRTTVWLAGAATPDRASPASLVEPASQLRPGCSEIST